MIWCAGCEFLCVCAVYQSWRGLHIRIIQDALSWNSETKHPQTTCVVFCCLSKWAGTRIASRESRSGYPSTRHPIANFLRRRRIFRTTRDTFGHFMSYGFIRMIGHAAMKWVCACVVECVVYRLRQYAVNGITYYTYHAQQIDLREHARVRATSARRRHSEISLSGSVERVSNREIVIWFGTVGALIIPLCWLKDLDTCQRRRVRRSRGCAFMWSQVGNTWDMQTCLGLHVWVRRAFGLYWMWCVKMRAKYIFVIGNILKFTTSSYFAITIKYSITCAIWIGDLQSNCYCNSTENHRWLNSCSFHYEIFQSFYSR